MRGEGEGESEMDSTCQSEKAKLKSSVSSQATFVKSLEVWRGSKCVQTTKPPKLLLFDLCDASIFKSVAHFRMASQAKFLFQVATSFPELLRLSDSYIGALSLLALSL